MLHLVRNLLTIRDPPASSTSSSTTQLEYSRLQSELIKQLEQRGFLTLLLTLGSMASKTEWNEVNVLVLDILWSMYRGVRASELIKDQQKVSIPRFSMTMCAEQALKAITPGPHREPDEVARGRGPDSSSQPAQGHKSTLTVWDDHRRFIGTCLFHRSKIIRDLT
jgi:hypothetical protein